MSAALPSPDAPHAGHCRCGRTTIAITAPPIMTAACHCRGCQRMSASAFSLTALVPVAAFVVTAGSPVRGGIKGPQLDHNFCPDCMSWMFTRIAGMDFVNVRPTMLDDPRWAVPFIETVTAEKLPWATTPARHRYAHYPPPEDYGPLMAEFAASL
jgi:hypothetical protein